MRERVPRPGGERPGPGPDEGRWRSMRERPARESRARAATAAPWAMAFLVAILAASSAMAISGVVDVRVELAPGLKARTSPDEVVYIFARATRGPKAPVAVVRTTVSALPLEVRLDDSRAVAPFLRISNFDEVVLSARVSRSGGARRASGDLEGRAGPVRTETTGRPVRLVIDHVVP